jgi:hypothetical protein
VSVLATHVRAICEQPVADATRPPGTEGGVVSPPNVVALATFEYADATPLRMVRTRK